MGLLSKVASWFRHRPAAAPSLAAERKIVSLLTPAQVEALGELPSFAICGVCEQHDGETIFRENRLFLDALHAAIARFGDNDAALAEAARRQGQGYVYVIDRRTPEGTAGSVPPCDIVGNFAVRDGVLVPGGYAANPAHRLLTAGGLFKLSPDMEAFVVAELMRSASTRVRD